jgi:hypothetical protein
MHNSCRVHRYQRLGDDAIEVPLASSSHGQILGLAHGWMKWRDTEVVTPAVTVVLNFTLWILFTFINVLQCTYVLAFNKKDTG